MSCPSVVCRLSITLLHPTRQKHELFGNIFAPPNSSGTRTKILRGSYKLSTKGYENIENIGIFRSMFRFSSKTVQDTAIVTTEDEHKLICDPSNSVISNYLEWPLTQISRTRHYSTFNICNIANIVLYVITKDYKRPSTLTGRNVRLSNLLITYCCSSQAFTYDTEWWVLFLYCNYHKSSIASSIQEAQLSQWGRAKLHVARRNFLYR